MEDGPLRVFDAALRPQRVVELSANIYTPLFLSSGEFIVPGDSGLFRLSPDTGAAPVLKKIEGSFSLATDSAEAFLAVGSVRPTGKRLRRKEIGIQLLSMAGLRNLRTVTVRRGQMYRPTLSPDGRLVAVHLHDLETEQKFVVVFEARNGREIWRRNSEWVNGLSFLPDGETLVVAGSKATHGEPIEIWRVASESVT